jgi:hypothetical protein
MADASRAVALAPKPAHSNQAPAERIAAFVRDVLARSALYSWPLTADASQNGTAPTLTRAGKIVLQLLQREQSGPLVDVRAVEAELAAHPALLPALASVAQPEQPQPSPPQVVGASESTGPVPMGTGPATMASGKTTMGTGPATMGGDSMAANPAKMPDAMSPTAFARWLGVDRRKIRQHIVEIPPGPVPALPPGKIPARRIANALRILRLDFLGEPGAVPPQVIEVGGNTNGHDKETAPGPAGEGALHRQIADLRRRYAQRG